MKIFSSEQIARIDAQTIALEGIDSIDLMERAARVFVDWFVAYHAPSDGRIAIFCGQGNNGGDGLAIARLLHGEGYAVAVFHCAIGKHGRPDFLHNLDRLSEYQSIEYQRLEVDDTLPDLSHFRVLIDGLFGSGLNRPIEGYWAKLIDHLNNTSVPTYAIDIPSGLQMDTHSTGVIIRAHRTLSFERPKLSFFMPENEAFAGTWTFRSIGLAPSVMSKIETPFHYIDIDLARSLIRSRPTFAHKGHFGHAALAVGSYGKVGAAILAAQACMRSGVGLLTCYLPECAYNILQIAVPEAMVKTDPAQHVLTDIDVPRHHEAVGIGCGIGTAAETAQWLNRFLEDRRKPVVLDADALNILSTNRPWLKSIPKGSILTPHPGEFKRLFGTSDNDFDRLHLAREKATELDVVIILKGAYTLVVTPAGDSFFNATGNPGMATAGSGDVLTGIVTSLLAQGYSSVETALLAVFIHGLAGDIVIEKGAEESLIAGDLHRHLPAAFQVLHQKKDE